VTGTFINVGAILAGTLVGAVLGGRFRRASSAACSPGSASSCS